MVQDSTTYYVWIGGSCGYGHKEPTHEARAETKLVWALPCKKEEDESQRAGGAAVVIEHDGSIISRDVISDFFPTIVSISKFPKRLSSASIFCIKMVAARQKKSKLAFLHSPCTFFLNLL